MDERLLSMTVGDRDPRNRMQQTYSAAPTIVSMGEPTAEDEGKTVVGNDGRELGVVDRVEDGTAYVDLDAGVEVTWGEPENGAFPIPEGSIDSIDDVVRLRGEH